MLLLIDCQYLHIALDFLMNVGCVSFCLSSCECEAKRLCHWSSSKNLVPNKACYIASADFFYVHLWSFSMILTVS